MGMLVIALPMEYTMSAGYRSGGEVSSTHGILLTIDHYYPVSISIYYDAAGGGDIRCVMSGFGV